MKSIIFLSFLAISVFACDTPEPATGSGSDSTMNNTDTTQSMPDTSGTMNTDTTTNLPATPPDTTHQ